MFSQGMEMQMKRILIVAMTGVAFAAFQSGVWAVDAKMAQDEMKEHGCVKCHDPAVKKVGPSYKDIGAKYKGKKVEEAMAGMKGKPVHKAALKNTTDSSLKVIMEWLQTQ